jgi:hypothetical protein
MKVQSVLFDSNIWDITSAIIYLDGINKKRIKNGKDPYLIPEKKLGKNIKMGNPQPKLDITKNRLRFRQFKPIYTKDTKYWIKKSKIPGIEFVMFNNT